MSYDVASVSEITPCNKQKENNSKRFSLHAIAAQLILANTVKNFLTLISNNPGLKVFTLNQVIDEINC